MALLAKNITETKPLTTIVSVNPATLDVLAEVEIHNREQVLEKVKKAREAFHNWSKTTIAERANYILAARDYIMNHSDQIAELITKENGKPLVESISAELLPTLDLMTYFAKHTEELITREKINLGKWSFLNKSSYIDYVPIGVIGVISPWNMPFTIPMGQVIMALMTGNTVVLKPSEHTPLVGLELQNIFDKIGLPAGVFNVVTGFGETGAHLVNSGVSKIVFTGSVATGKKIMAAASATLTPVVLELGGKDAMIVLDDANLDNSVSGAIWGAFTNSGQVCASVERVYVHESIADEFTYAVANKTKRLKQGNGINKDMEVGPMISMDQLRIVESHVREAVEHGAKVLAGGEKNNDLPGYFFKPTVLTRLNKDSKVVNEETFGPVLPVMTFKTEEEAIQMANNSRYGLTASIWTPNIDRAEKIASQIEAGTVSINDCITTFALCQTPWGGGKESGIGRTHGKMGLMEFLEPRHIHIDKAYNTKKFWWYGYDANRYDLFKQTLNILFSNDKVTSLPKLVKDFMKSKSF